GTQIVKDMSPGVEASVPQKSIIYNGDLYFSCYNGAATGLWKSDGTNAETVMIKQGGGSDPFFRDTKFAPVFNGLLYFVVNDNQFYPLWQTDGTSTGTKPAVFQNTAAPAFSQSSDFKFTIFNSELYFSGECGTISLSFQPCKLTNGTLPLSWLGVQAKWINESEAKVSWQVAQQKNIKNYAVQYSSDGNDFLNVCLVISSAITSYNCVLPANKNTKNYYRVMQTDIDGKTTYSKIVLLQASAKPSLSVYPNPAKDKLYIQGINNFSEATVSDATGKIMKHTFLNSGNYYLDVSRLSRGVYFVKLASGNNIQTVKFNKA
ncbi:MAG: T9SS type A sorting domain-containing protein, partial [Ginsengibacter sp.]